MGNNLWPSRQKCNNKLAHTHMPQWCSHVSSQYRRTGHNRRFLLLWFKTKWRHCVDAVGKPVHAQEEETTDRPKEKRDTRRLVFFLPRCICILYLNIFWKGKKKVVRFNRIDIFVTCVKDILVAKRLFWLSYIGHRKCRIFKKPVCEHI